MDFEWDPQQARENVAKHAIEFADALGVLEDPDALTMLDPHESEERWVTLGAIFSIASSCCRGRGRARRRFA